MGKWYAGELLLLPNTRLESAVQVCERLRNKIAKHHWHVIHPALSVTISMGLCRNQKHVDLEPLIAQADARLYEAKNTGKNRVCF
jgi:diguanylate cyclase (GGDEF)-like protein